VIVSKILAVGDCNTLGAGTLVGNSFPERVGRQLGVPVYNIGHTMATTREGVKKISDTLGSENCVFIQFGLVDSYLTFKYSPYILYYPDNPLRSFMRSITKKYKKSCRKFGLNEKFGEVNVVPAEEYEENICKMIETCGERTVILVDTVPNRELWRNAEIRRYNSILDRLASAYDNCHRLLLYEDFEKNGDTFYLDATHCNSRGYDFITEKMIALLKEKRNMADHQ